MYEVNDVENLIANTPGIESFCFAYFLPQGGDALQLVAYAYIEAGDKYAPDYDTLAVFPDADPLFATGPFKMCDNIVSLDEMKTLISDDGSGKPDFLVFSPGINESGYIFYKIFAYQNSQGNDKPHRVRGGDLGVDSNPSPPAT
jgi:hypothetical protein